MSKRLLSLILLLVAGLLTLDACGSQGALAGRTAQIMDSAPILAQARIRGR